MKLLDHYLARTVLMAMLMVLALMVAVELIFSLADELGDTTEVYHSGHAIAFVLLTTPTSIYELLPYAALGGALIGLGLLASSNELVVMRSAGVSTRRIIWSVMKPTLLVMAFSLVLGEWLAPMAEQKARSDQAMVLSGGEAIGSGRGNWHKIGDTYVHINAVVPGGREVYGVTRYEFNGDRELLRSSFASHGRYLDAEQHWLLTEVRETRFREQRTEVVEHEQYEWQVDLPPELLSVLLVRPDRQSISGLYQFARYFESEGLESSNYFLAFWKKLLQPLATISLVLLAISFVFGPLREATMGYRVFVGIMIALSFTIAERMLGPTTLLYGFSPLFAVLLPIVVAASLGLFMLRRV